MLAEDPALLTALFGESLESLAGLIGLDRVEDGLRALCSPAAQHV